MTRKVLIFVEGASEGALVTALIRKVYWDKFTRYSSFFEFVDFVGEGNFPLYIQDCEGVQRLGPEIESRSHIFKDNLDYLIFTLADVEESIECFTGRKQEILKDITSFDPNRVLHIFSKPYLEDVYWFHPNDILRCLKKMYQVRFKNQLDPSIDLASYSKTQGGLKKLFVDNGLKYVKPIFAENYFNGFDFEQSEHPTIKRLIRFLGSI